MTKIEIGMVNRIKEILGYAPLTQHFIVKLKSLVEEVVEIKNPKARSDLLSRMDQMLAPFYKKKSEFQPTRGERLLTDVKYEPNEILEKAGRMMEEFKKESAIRILSELGLFQTQELYGRYTRVNTGGLAWIEDGIKEGSRAGVTFIDREGVRCFMNDGAWETISPLLDELISRRKEEP